MNIVFLPMRLVFCAGLILFGKLAYAQIIESPLVDVEWLEGNFSEVTLLDIRAREELEASALELPQSIQAPYQNWTSSSNPLNPGGLDIIQVQKMLVELGLKQSQPIVIVSAGERANDAALAARVYWTLKVFGFESVAILNGGFAALDGGFVEVQEKQVVNKVSAEKRGSFPRPEAQEKMIATKADIDIAQKSSDSRIIDARILEQFLGTAKSPATNVFGAIAQAQHFDNRDLLTGDKSFIRSEFELEFALEDFLETHQDHQLIVYCNQGQSSALTWFVLHELLGFDEVRLYPDSFVGYANEESPRLQHQPDRLYYLLAEVADMWAYLKNER